MMSRVRACPNSSRISPGNVAMCLLPLLVVNQSISRQMLYGERHAISCWLALLELESCSMVDQKEMV